MGIFFKERLGGFVSWRATRLSGPAERAPRLRRPRKAIRNVAISQAIVDTRIRKPSAVFRFSNTVDSIHFQNGFHFNKYRNPQYARNAMAMRQTFWKKGGVFAAGPLRRSHIANAAAKRKSQEDIQLSLESIYSVQRTLPSHWEMASC